MTQIGTQPDSIHFALRHAREFVSAERGVIAPLSISEEELNPGLQDDLRTRAEAIEATAACYTVPYDPPADSACSEFEYFEDGRQRTVHIGYLPFSPAKNQTYFVPVHFFIVAAAILERQARRLKVWGKPEVQYGILVDASLVPDQAVLDQYRQAGLSVVDTKGAGGDYYALRRRALTEAKALRLSAENRLIGSWTDATEGSDKLLIVDGTLMNLRNEQALSRCVGVSKSFGSRYFDMAEHTRIIGMIEGQRSWTFRFHGEDETASDLRLGTRERLSWYLRIRSGKHVDPEFGLLRLEAGHQHLRDAPNYADRISRSVLSERLPTSYPADRWHNHLFPVSACESYLSTIMPSLQTIAASMRG